jgi:colanic acid biosynthesis glycosyl transferase WcaI
LRILFLTLYFAPDIAANAVVMTELAEELTTLGHKVTVVTAFPHYAGNVIDHRYRRRLIQWDEHKGIHVIRTYLYTSPQKRRFRGRFLSYVSFNLLSTLAGLFAGSHDVILAPSPPLTIGLSAYVISRVKRVPYVYNVQDIYPDVMVKLGILKKPWTIALFRCLECFVYNHARHITVLSEGFQVNLLHKGVPPQKIKVIPNFVDTEFVRPLPRHNRFSAEQGLDDKFVILFAGNMGFSQGLETVLEAATQLRDQKDILFLVVGNGAEKPRLMKYAQELDLENVRFLPFQPHRVVPNLYASSDVCLAPLRKGLTAESMPSKVYTITAAGRPLIASVNKDSDVYHFIKEAKCGLWVEPEEPKALAKAICTLYAHPALRQRLGRNGREHVVQHYTRHAVAQQYHELLMTLGGMEHG